MNIRRMTKLTKILTELNKKYCEAGSTSIAKFNTFLFLDELDKKLARLYLYEKRKKATKKKTKKRAKK